METLFAEVPNQLLLMLAGANWANNAERNGAG
jgi:hypothetical protein